MGKTFVIKQLCFSKLVHLAFTLPLPSEEQTKIINKMFFQFLWDSNTERMARNTLYQSWGNGGLAFPDVFIFLKTLRLGWIKRYWKSRTTGIKSDWMKLMDINLHNFGVEHCFFVGSKKLAQMGKTVGNAF